MLRLGVLPARDFAMNPGSSENVVRLKQFAPALSAVSLVVCLTLTRGFLNPAAGAWQAMLLLTLSLFSCLAAIAFPDVALPRFERVPLLRFVGRAPVLSLLVGCLAFEALALCGWFANLRPLFAVATFCIAIALWSGRVEKSAWRKTGVLSFVGAIFVFLVCAVLLLSLAPAPKIDVIVFQRDSPVALAQGQNPYTLTFPDIYGAKSSLFYGPGASVKGVLQFGFPYLPLALLWIAPAQLLLGDFRYAYLLAVVIAAVCIFRLHRSSVAVASSLLLLFSLPTFFVLQHGWTEPLPVMLLCLVAWSSRFRKLPSFWTVGLLAAAKQYLILLFPLLILLPGEKSKKGRLGDVVKAVAIAACITLPFVVWNPRAFFHSALFIQVAQPFRDDSLSYLSFFKLVTGIQPPSWPGFLMAILALAFCLWRAPRTTTGFALSVALVMFGFIAFARQAFINYYFLIFGVLCCATALANSETDETEPLTAPAAAAAR